MKDLLLFALLGLGPGALIAGVALAMVLFYRSGGVVNLATGAIAAWGAFTFYDLNRAGDLLLPPLPFAPHRLNLGGPIDVLPAFVITLLSCLVLGVLLELLVFRRLRATSPLAKLVASLGVLLLLFAILLLRYGTTAPAAPAVLPNGPNDVVDVFGVPVPTDRLQLAAIVVAVAGLLMLLYRLTRFGLATRAASENEAAALYAGLSPNTISMVNTLLACVLAGALGVLAAPTAQLDVGTLTFTVVPALGAALLAGFTSFGLAVGAGVGMGIVQSLVIYLQTKSWFPNQGGAPIPGVADLMYFLVIVGAIAWRARSLPLRGRLAEQRLPLAPRADRVLAPALAAACLAAAAFLVFPFDFRQALLNSLIAAVLCLSLVVITGLAGQVSILQLTLAGVAGVVVAKLGIEAGIGFPLGPVLGVTAATLVGLAIAVSALRVRGINLGIATLVAALAIERFVFDNPRWGAGEGGSLDAPNPHLLGLDIGPQAGFPIGDGNVPSPLFGLLCVIVALLLGLLVVGLRRSVLGQTMLAVRSNEEAAAGNGISPARVKLIAFGLASFIAGCAGVMSAYSLGAVTLNSITILSGLAIVAFAYLGGITTAVGAVIGGLLVTDGLVSHALEKWLGVPPEYQLIVAGLALILTVVASPAGVDGAVRAAWRSLRRPRGSSPGEPGLPAEAPT